MTNYQVFEKIINFATITTIKDKTAYINKYKPDSKKIDANFIRTLINLDILELDSGNFETGEEHYMLNDNFIKINPKDELTINMNKIEKFIELDNIRKPRKSFLELRKIYFKFKINMIRKQKLLKINNSI